MQRIVKSPQPTFRIQGNARLKLSFLSAHLKPSFKTKRNLKSLSPVNVKKVLLSLSISKDKKACRKRRNIKLTNRMLSNLKHKGVLSDKLPRPKETRDEPTLDRSSSDLKHTSSDSSSREFNRKSSRQREQKKNTQTEAVEIREEDYRKFEILEAKVQKAM
mmetsp:Transcript_9787/g.10992  ORF Transcript_9787/g.10992 Transcript_9787/m.10992 type:complete len:161 (+) Transcript_9787:2-484(+)